MSYHDGYDRPLMEGRAVVNPLIRIENKLKQIANLLADADEMEVITVADLKARIEGIIRE